MADIINCVFLILYFKLVNDLKSICLDWRLKEESTIPVGNFGNHFDCVSQSDSSTELEIL